MTAPEATATIWDRDRIWVTLGAVALMLMTGGSGLLWLGSRRRRDEDEGNE